MGNCCRKSKSDRDEETSYYRMSRRQGKLTFPSAVAIKHQSPKATKQSYRSTLSDVVPDGGNSHDGATDTKDIKKESLQHDRTTIELNTPVTDTKQEECLQLDRTTILLNSPITCTNEEKPIHLDRDTTQLDTPGTFANKKELLQLDRPSSSQLSTPGNNTIEEESWKSDEASSCQLSTPGTYTVEDESGKSDGANCSQLSTPENNTVEKESQTSDGASCPQLSSPRTYTAEKESGTSDEASSSQLSTPNTYTVEKESGTSDEASSYQLSIPRTDTDEEDSWKSDEASSSQLSAPNTYTVEKESGTSDEASSSQLSTPRTDTDEEDSWKSDESCSSQLQFTSRTNIETFATSAMKTPDAYRLSSTLETSSSFSEADIASRPAKRKMDNRGSCSQHCSPSVKPTFKKMKPDIEQLNIDKDMRCMVRENLTSSISVEPTDIHNLERDLRFFTEYGEECYANNRSVELQFLPGDCLAQTVLQEDDRRNVVLSLLKSHSKHRLSLESLCLAVNYTDRILLHLRVEKCTYNIMAVTSMILALKTAETRTEDIDDIIDTCRHYYVNTTMWAMEALIMRKLDYRLSAPTTNVFLEHLIMKRLAKEQLNAQTVRNYCILMGYAKAVAKLCLLDYYYCVVPPSLQAICCIKAAEYVLCLEGPVTTELQGYAEERVQKVLSHTIFQIKKNVKHFKSLIQYEKSFYHYSC